jgi:hypothetical protein
MNEQIDKLLVNAGAYFSGDGVDYSRFEPKKFAELIVRECAVIIGSMEEPHQDIAKLVKEHFGVEE